MINAKLSIFIIICMVSILGCASKRVSKQEMAKFLRDEDNGLIQKVNVGNANLEIVYNPTELLFKDKKEIPKFIYFSIKISIEGKSLDKYLYLKTLNDPELKERLSFRLKEYIQLISSTNDTIRPVEVVKNDLNTNESASVWLIVFDKGSINNEVRTLDITVKEFGAGLGTNHFIFRKKDLDNIPEII
jgi:hypothetical protein